MIEIKSTVDALVGKLTLEEKASLCSGKDLWHLKGLPKFDIKEVMMTDGPHGLRKQKSAGDQLSLTESVPATCFPTAVGLAATWNCTLLQEIGTALGQECQQEGVSILLGPGMNIKRSPLCGRNFEYYSEDPYLTGECAAAFIHGVQSQGIGTSVKHFAVNNQEKYRMSVNALVDERAMRELYLAGFEKAVRQAQPWTVMAAYNQVNNAFATENVELLDKILREEWGFAGVVLSDWGATNDRVLALQAGLDLEMPSSHGMNDKLLVAAVHNGSLKEETLDITVKRMLTLILRSLHQQKADFKYDRAAHHQLAQKAAAESMVLLKNDKGLLPLPTDTKIALIGEFAQKPRYQGAGSSFVLPNQLDTAYDTALKRLGDKFTYAPGYLSNADTIDEKRLFEAVSIAKDADVVVLMVGLTESHESEGFDRSHLQLPHSHNRLIEAVCRVNSNVVIVLNNGAPVLMPWLNDVTAVLEAYLPGEAGGSAIWEVLFGDVNPSGHLAESFPANENDYAAAHYFPMGPTSVEYRESIYVGYRFYDSAQVEPLFPFGFGLSYTTFSYSNLKLSKTKLETGVEVTVSVTIENTGNRAGMEVVQLYVSQQNPSIFRPHQELKGFKKIQLEPSEAQTITFTLDKRAFAYYHVQLQDWHVESGEFLIKLGASSRDIRCQENISITSELQQAAVHAAPSIYNRPARDWRITQADFAQLYGREIPQLKTRKRYHRNSTLEDTKHNLIGKFLYKHVIKGVHKAAKGNAAQARMMEAVVRELPLRGVVMMSSSAMTFEQIDGLIDLMNGNIISGLRHLCKSKHA